MHATKSIACNDCAESRNCPMRALGPDTLKRTDTGKRMLLYAQGESVYHQDDPASAFFAVRKGRVQLFRFGPYREVSYAILGPGSWFGYRDVLQGADYGQSARALQQAVVCKFDGGMLGELMATEPSFSQLVARELADGWSQAENQTYNLSARKIVERLADFLLALESQSLESANEEGRDAAAAEEKNGRQAWNGTPLEIPLPHTRELIGSMIGSTTESVIRALSDFKARGWIDLSKGKVVLRNRGELSRLVAES